MIEGRLLMIGCGNMGRAMLDRWLAAGLSPEQVTVVTPSGRPMPAGVQAIRSVPESSAEPYRVVMLALKPQQLEQLRGGPLAGHAPELLLSILAGVQEDVLSSLCPARSVVRAMPNLPVAIGRGVTALHSRGGDEGARTLAAILSTPLGLVEWVEEAQFDAVTALAGCGPGFVFRFADALAAAGAALGLAPEQALRLALATLNGAAAMALDSDASPAMLADRVASPGGSTRAGLNVLDRGGALRSLMTETLAASAKRNGEMAVAARISVPATTSL